MAKVSKKAAPAIISKRSRSFGDVKFMGYRRENGRVGVRNHVAILPVDDISNAACVAVAMCGLGALGTLVKLCPARQRRWAARLLIIYHETIVLKWPGCLCWPCLCCRQAEC